MTLTVTQITPTTPMPFPYFSVLYTEGDPQTYAGIRVIIGDQGAVFYSGDPVHDYLCALLSIPNEWHDVGITCSSSVDHFVMDGGVLGPEGEYTDKQIREAREALASLEEPC